MNTSIIIYGPQGCGKSMNAESLAKFFERPIIIDEWVSGEALPKHNAIILTTQPQKICRGRGCLTMSFDKAMDLAGLKESWAKEKAEMKSWAKTDAK